jgi:hypothetical protein
MELCGEVIHKALLKAVLQIFEDEDCRAKNGTSQQDDNLGVKKKVSIDSKDGTGKYIPSPKQSSSMPGPLLECLNEKVCIRLMNKFSNRLYPVLRTGFQALLTSARCH